MENNMFDISVIVCCYNPDILKLKKTIISINKQQDINYEIIITDDGSKKIEYKELLINWIKDNKINNVSYNFLENNVGTIKNIISAIELSNSKYIKLISPGDYLFDNNSLKKYYEELNSGNDLVFSRSVHYFEEKIYPIQYPENDKIYKNKNLLKRVVKYNDYISGATIAFKKDIGLNYLKSIETNIKYLEDAPLTFLMLLDRKKVKAIDEFLVWYEDGSGISTNSSVSPLLVNDYNNLYEYLSKNYSKNRLVKKSIKNYKYNLSGGKIKRIIKRTLVSCGFILNLFERIKSRKKDKTCNVNITKLHDITEVDHGVQIN